MKTEWYKLEINDTEKAYLRELFEKDERYTQHRLAMNQGLSSRICKTDPEK